MTKIALKKAKSKDGSRRETAKINRIIKKAKSEHKKLSLNQKAEDLSKKELRELAASCFDSLIEKLTG